MNNNTLESNKEMVRQANRVIQKMGGSPKTEEMTAVAMPNGKGVVYVKKGKDPSKALAAANRSNWEAFVEQNKGKRLINKITDPCGPQR